MGSKVGNKRFRIAIEYRCMGGGNGWIRQWVGRTFRKTKRGRETSEGLVPLFWTLAAGDWDPLAVARALRAAMAGRTGSSDSFRRPTPRPAAMPGGRVPTHGESTARCRVSVSTSLERRAGRQIRQWVRAHAPYTKRGFETTILLRPLLEEMARWHLSPTAVRDWLVSLERGCSEAERVRPPVPAEMAIPASRPEPTVAVLEPE